MYLYHSIGDITLWCYSRETQTKRKLEIDNHSATAHLEKEDQVGEAFKTFKEKHKSKYEVSKLYLWSI